MVRTGWPWHETRTLASFCISLFVFVLFLLIVVFGNFVINYPYFYGSACTKSEPWEVKRVICINVASVSMIFILDFRQCGILELCWQCGILELCWQCDILELCWQCGILELCWQCGILELCWQCGIFCSSFYYTVNKEW
jgi:hypothetical protein